MLLVRVQLRRNYRQNQQRARVFLFSPKLGISENQWKELCLKKQVQTLPGIVFTLIWDQCLGTGGGCGGEGTWEEGQRRNPGERGRNWKQSKKSKKVRGEVRGGKTKENYCLETCFKYHRRGMLCTKRGSHGMNASLFGQDRSSTAAKCQLMIKCVCGGRFGGKHCGFYGGFWKGVEW